MEWKKTNRASCVNNDNNNGGQIFADRGRRQTFQSELFQECLSALGVERRVLPLLGNLLEGLLKSVNDCPCKTSRNRWGTD